MPPAHDVVVIGGSAGAVETVLRLVSTLPAVVPARIFLTIHFPSTATSVLPNLLARAGALPAKHAVDGEETQPGIVYVAPPDFHLVVKPGHVRVVRGPRENRHRPAIDPLFRSAAASYGSRVAAIVLSGTLDDGSTGALAVHAAGGTVIVQDPDDALYPGMPRNALAMVPSATVLSLDRIGEGLVRMLTAPVNHMGGYVSRDDGTSAAPIDPVELHVEAAESFSKLGRPSGLTCPECNGGIFELDAESSGAPRYRCRVGHAFSSETLFSEQKASLEVALWTAGRALEESAELARRLESRARSRANRIATDRYGREAGIHDQRARAIREVLRSGLPTLDEGSGSAIPGYAEP